MVVTSRHHGTPALPDPTPRDVPVVGGEYLGVGGDIGVGEPRPTPHTCHNDAARRHWVQLPHLRDTFDEGLNFLKSPPRHPVPFSSELLLRQRRGRSGSLACSSLGPALNNTSKFFATTFVACVAATPRLHHPPPPHLPIPCFDKPPKHNVAVPINTVDGQLGGALPCWGWGRGCPSPHGGVREGVQCGGGVQLK